MPRAATPATAPVPTRRLAAARREDGFTLIEVLISAVIVVLASLAVLGAIDATQHASYQVRLHSDAQALAEQDEDRLRGLTVSELSNLNRTLAPVTLDGVQFTISETASYVSSGTGTASCSSPSTDYLKTTSTVTWQNMGSSQPVTLTSVQTPPIGSVGSGTGGMAVTVADQGTGISGMTVSLSGPGSASQTTDANGCALFGDMPAGTYTVSVYSPAGTYVDETTGAAVTASSPDTVSQGITAGSISSASFNVDVPGTLNYSFVSTASNPAADTPGAIAVVAYNSTIIGNHTRVCTLADGSSCPAEGAADTAFPASDWSQVANVSPFPATPLFPFNGGAAGSYAVYAGVCSADDPASNGGTDVTATLAPGGTTAVSVKVPAMIIQVYGGTSSLPVSMGLPTHLYIRDKGCNVRYTGYSSSASPPVPAAGANPEQAVVPLSASYASGAAGGVLAYPGMPYGSYEVCADNGVTYSAAAVTNNNATPVVKLYLGSPTGLVSSELGSGSSQC